MNNGKKNMSQLHNFERVRALIKSYVMPKIPPDISKNYRGLDGIGEELITQSLKAHYFAQSENRFGSTIEDYLSSQKGSGDFQDHLIGRLEQDRRTIVPWLNKAMSLAGTNILELGCGTGCSTVALAEQGANITALDVNNDSINVAKDRCKIYDIKADFVCANACDAHEIFPKNKFDIIIFFATLEHMTYEERMIAMKSTWEMLPQGGLWVVIETPNRLWYLDGHTSRLPFYSWLPDNLAFKYSKFSPREGFNQSYRSLNEESMHEFLRRGRGVSYHEFDLTLKKAENLKVISSLQLFLRNQSLLWRAKWRFSVDHRFESVLLKVGPKIHRGFYQPGLNLIIEKD